MSNAWDKYKQMLSGFTPEEIAILRPEYDKYLQERYKWEWDDDAVLSFSDWWRAMADNVKSQREGK